MRTWAALLVTVGVKEIGLIRRIFLIPLLAGLAACQSLPSGYDPARLSSARMDELVAQPIARVEAGDLAGGVAAFDALLARRPAGSLAAADLLTAFGVNLHSRAQAEEDRSLSALSLTYLQRAVDAYRARFGPDHPEVALALNSWADVERELRPHAPEAAEAALVEVLRIRRIALGASHGETLWATYYLAQTRSGLAWTRNEPARIEQVSADLIALAALARANPAGIARPVPVIAQLQRARLYARHRRLTSALAAFAAARAEALRSGDSESCETVVNASGELHETLEAQGFAAKLGGLRRDIEAEGQRCAALERED